MKDAEMKRLRELVEKQRQMAKDAEQGHVINVVYWGGRAISYADCADDLESLLNVMEAEGSD